MIGHWSALWWCGWCLVCPIGMVCQIPTNWQTISIHPRCYIKRSIDCLRRSCWMFKFPSLYMASLFIKFKDQIKWILNLYSWWDILIRENGINKWNFILLLLYIYHYCLSVTSAGHSLAIGPAMYGVSFPVSICRASVYSDVFSEDSALHCNISCFSYYIFLGKGKGVE